MIPLGSIITGRHQKTGVGGREKIEVSHYGSVGSGKVKRLVTQVLGWLRAGGGFTGKL
ncbi:hypothetical protein SBA4_2040011 [Candidatus Sulfopaludibacter sp. SbA4]|nr:hypothetical protein SBA4_2040011 [Candidatus Sulfopaludibacter sp. SbA4]